MKYLVLIFSIIILSSCSTADDAGDVIMAEFDQIETILPQEKWEVSNLFIHNEDHTSDFQNFNFTFREDGTVEGKTDLIAETGTWVYKSTLESGEQLIVQFSETPPFDGISNDWKIISLSNSKIELIDEGNSSEDTRLLSFSNL